MNQSSKEIDKKAVTLWNKAQFSFINYQNYVNSKENRFQLTLIDLLYISNFKGGNATIHEPEKDIEQKLISYSDKLIEIHNQFRDRSLGQLNGEEVQKLALMVECVCNLTDKSSKTKIDGFSVSYLSALLNAYFPNLIPILDRRLLINLDLIQKNDIQKSGQIKQIRKFYGPLINSFATLCSHHNLSVRELDKKIFTQKIKKNV